MALAKLLTGEYGRMDGQYHRIQQVIYDYDTNQLHFTIFHYADQSFRDQEKAEVEEKKEKIQRYYELEAKKQEYDEKKTGMPFEEWEELAGLNIQELSKLDFEPRHIGSTNYTIEITGDPREEIYNEIEQTIGQFEGAVEI